MPRISPLTSVVFFVMFALIVLATVVIPLELTAVPPRPMIHTLNPRCFPAGQDTVLDVYGLNFGGKLSLIVNGKMVTPTVAPADPTTDGGYAHLQTTVNFPGTGYVNVQVRSQYGGNVLYSTPLAWSYVLSPSLPLPAGEVNKEYGGSAAGVDLNIVASPSVCNFRTRPWYQETQ